MQIVVEMVEAAKKARTIGSDAALARLMKITPQTLSQWRNGDVPVPTKRVEQLAKLANEPPAEWVLAYQTVTAETPELRNAFAEALGALYAWWELSAEDRAKFTRKAKAATAGAIALCAIGLTTIAATSTAYAQNLSGMHIM